MYEKVKAYVEKYRMLTAEDKVIAGISGGADSVCLLFVLLRLKEEIGFGIHAVHVNHGIRGEAADRDEGFVRRLCQEKETPLTVFREDVALYARDYKMTEEEAGRKVRRESFEKTLGDVGGTKIALAHHMNDNAETVLWNLCRGTGIRGLGGIAPSSGVWIRPFLCVKREEIESYLEKWGISYCTDETNSANTYTRNKIRNELLPYMEQNLNRQAARHITEAASRIRILEGYMRREAMRGADECLREDKRGRLILLKDVYASLDSALKDYVLHEAICRAAGGRKDIESVHVEMLAGLLKRQVGRRISLPYKVTAIRCYEGACFVRECSKGSEDAAEPVFRVFDKSDGKQAFHENLYTKWFDYGIIKNTVKIRHRQPGDYLTIDREGNRQKLKQYFINEKIPQEKRDSIWLAADGSHIMWVVGYRQSQAYQVTEQTTKILEIQFYGGEGNGREDQSDV